MEELERFCRCPRSAHAAARAAGVILGWQGGRIAEDLNRVSAVWKAFTNTRPSGRGQRSPSPSRDRGARRSARAYPCRPRDRPSARPRNRSPPMLPWETWPATAPAPRHLRCQGVARRGRETPGCGRSEGPTPWSREAGAGGAGSEPGRRDRVARNIRRDLSLEGGGEPRSRAHAPPSRARYRDQLLPAQIASHGRGCLAAALFRPRSTAAAGWCDGRRDA